jgi:hypothetical protein
VTYFLTEICKRVGVVLVLSQLDRIHLQLPLPNQQGDTARQPL